MEDDGLIVFVEEKVENVDSNTLDIRNGLKLLKEKISMRKAMSREIWFWD